MPHSKSVKSRTSIKSKIAKSKTVKSSSSVNMYHFIEACKNGHTEVLKQLLPTIDINGFYDNATPLYFATKANHINVIKFLINNGADVNLGSTLNNETALDIAAKLGNLDAVKMLIKAGADVNQKDANGDTSLYYTFSGIHHYNDDDKELERELSVLIATLIVNGADIHSENNNGLTAEQEFRWNLEDWPDDTPFLLLSGEISPEYVLELYKKEGIKELYKYVSISPENKNEDDISPRTTYRQLTKENQITMVGTHNRSRDNMFRIKIDNPIELFSNYRNLANPNRVGNDCGFQTLFALGLLDRNEALKGAKSVNIARNALNMTDVGLDLGTVRRHICRIFGLKETDLRTRYYYNPDMINPISIDELVDFFAINLENNMATFVRIAWDTEIGHFIVVFKQNDIVQVFDPQRTSKTMSRFSNTPTKNPIFYASDLVKEYTYNNSEPAYIYEFNYYSLKKNKKFADKPLKTEMCSANLKLLLGGENKTRKGHKLAHRNKTIRHKKY
jgi:hypothetical protein